MANDLKASDFKAEANLDAGETLNKKIRNAQLAHYNFILGESFVFVNLCEMIIRRHIWVGLTLSPSMYTGCILSMGLILSKVSPIEK